MSNETRKPNWFTIKQAADYLEVGEPTLYRWMRDKRITFRKVGDSTRFLQEDLDAMITVHPSSVDLEKVRQLCPYCHHDELIDGRVQSTGHTYFRPAKTRFWTYLTGNVDTSSRMCTRCGAIVWFGNVATLRALTVPRPAGAADDSAVAVDVEDVKVDEGMDVDANEDDGTGAGDGERAGRR